MLTDLGGCSRTVTSLCIGLTSFVAFVTCSIPLYVFALLAVRIFAGFPVRLDLPRLPTLAMFDPRDDKDLLDLLLHLILPTQTPASVRAASYARSARASMLPEIHLDFGRTALAKGCMVAGPPACKFFVTRRFRRYRPSRSIPPSSFSMRSLARPRISLRRISGTIHVNAD